MTIYGRLPRRQKERILVNSESGIARARSAYNAREMERDVIVVATTCDTSDTNDN